MTIYRFKVRQKCRFCGAICRLAVRVLEPICKSCRDKDRKAVDMPLSSISTDWLAKQWSSPGSNRRTTARGLGRNVAGNQP